MKVGWSKYEALAIELGISKQAIKKLFLILLAIPITNHDNSSLLTTDLRLTH